MSGFPSAVVEELRLQTRLPIDTIDQKATYYEENWHNVPGAPSPDALTKELARAAEALGTFEVERDKNWAGLVKRLEEAALRDSDRGDPYLPVWYAKTDDRPNLWTSDTEGASDEFKSAIATALRHARPLTSLPVVTRLEACPTSDMDSINLLIPSIRALRSLFIWDIGEGDADNFRWGPSVCVLAGLGLTVLKSIGQYQSDEPAWDHWSHISPDEHEELAKDVLDCHKCSGYPVGLLRMEWHRIKQALLQEAFTGNCAVSGPSWLVPYLALHILKHTRLWSDGDGSKMFIAYRGRHSIVPVLKDHMNMSLGQKDNKPVAKVVCEVLGLPYNPGKIGRSWIHEAVDKVLGYMSPSAIPRARPTSSALDLLVAPAISMELQRERRGEYRWIDPGIGIRNLATIDIATNEVDKTAVLDGPRVLLYRWPELLPDPSTIPNWHLMVPDEVKPERFSTVLLREVGNLNTLGYPEGYAMMIDAVMAADFFRTELAGSPVGHALQREFPFLAILPTSGNPTETTNQGKTNLGRILGGAMVPEMIDSVRTFDRSSGAPAQRAMAAPIRRHGTAIFDEFITPQAHDHFMGRYQMVSLATGGTGGPGLVMENESEMKLTHPLVLTSKFSSFPPDALNRLAPSFMDMLSDTTRCTEDKLADILGGKISLLARLSHMLWCRKHRLVERLYCRSLVSGKWRWNGHLTIATMFGNLDRLYAYLEAGEAKCKDQLAAAEGSGLVDEVGATAVFDPKYYIQNASDLTLRQLSVSSADSGILPLQFLREIVEDNGARRLNDELNKFKIKERAAQFKFTTLLQTKPFHHDHWEVHLVGADKSGIRDEHGNLRRSIRIINHKDKKEDSKK